MAALRIGISGWRYPGWRGVFYPTGLPQRRELEYAAQHFNSVELNGSFYSLQRPECYRAWASDTPADFEFAVKGGRFITHMKKLRGVEAALANFFASGVLCLGRKLGPLLWQFPEQLPFTDSRFAEFFELLPRTTSEAAALARQHDERLSGRSFTQALHEGALRHAVEVRHESFRSPEFVKLLRRHNIALVVADTAKRWPCFEDVTADFVYVRLHGDTQLYTSGYSADALQFWAKRVRAWHTGGQPDDARLIEQRPPKARKSRDVYVYFDNDAKVHAPFDALSLASTLDPNAPGSALPLPEPTRRARNFAQRRRDAQRSPWR